MKRKAIILASVMLLNVIFPITTMANENTKTGDCGETLTWTLDEGELVIEGTGGMDDYESVAQRPWHLYKDEIESIVIKEGVTDVGNHAFYDCKNVHDIELADSIINIGKYAFASMGATCELILPENLKEIESHAFYYNEFTGELVLPENLEKIGDYAFAQNKFIGNLVIPEKVDYIGEYAFSSAIYNQSNHYTAKLLMERVPNEVCENAFGQIYIISPYSIRVGDKFKCILGGSFEIPKIFVKNWISSNEDVLKVDEGGVITAISEGTAEISVVLHNGEKIDAFFSVLVQRKDAEVVRGDITWFIPEKIKLGYEICSKEVGNDVTVAEIRNIPEENYEWYALASVTNRPFLSYPIGAAIEEIDKITATDSFCVSAGGYYAMVPGELVYKISISNSDTKEHYDFGEPYTVTIEEPIIETNAPKEVVVGDSITLESYLGNTELKDESIVEYKTKIDESKEKDHYCFADYPVFEPKFIVESGKELVECSEGDFTHSLSASEKLTFKGSGTVKIRIQYNYLETCRMLHFNYSDLTYVPEKVVEIQVTEKRIDKDVVLDYTEDKIPTTEQLAGVIKDVSEKGKVTINVSNTFTLESNVLNKLKNGKHEIVINKINTDKHIYSWSISSINDTSKAWNTDIIMDKEVTEVTEFLNSLKYDGKSKIISFEHEGQLPGKASVSLYVGDTFENGKTIYYYYFNEIDGTAEKVGDYKVDANGYITVEIDHCSDYIVADKLIVTEEDTNQDKENNQQMGNDQQGNNNQQDGSNQEENNNQQNGDNQKEDVEAPKTGYYGMYTLLWGTVILSVMGIIGVFLKSKQK